MSEKTFDFYIKKLISVVFTIFVIMCLAAVILNKQVRVDFVFLKNSNLLWVIFIVICSILAILTVSASMPVIRKAIASGNKVLIQLTIVLAAASPRLVWINLVDPVPKSDFKLYNDFASHFIQGDITAGQNYISLFPHTFGYPFVLSFFYNLFGSDYHVAQLINILIGCGIAIIIYRLGKRLIGPAAGFLAALFYAFWPSQVFYSATVSTEAIFTLFMLLGVLLFIKSLENKRLLSLKLIGIGMLCAFINSIRPFGILLVAVFSIMLFITSVFKREPFRQVFIKGLCPVIALAISYFAACNLISAGISSAIDKEVAGFPVGYSLLQGGNTKFSGRWNPEDNKILSGMVDYGPFDAQAVHDRLILMAEERYISQGMANIRLFEEKFKVMWSQDDDILFYIKAELASGQKSGLDFDKSFRLLRLLCNTYYLIMLLLCLCFSVAALRKNPETRTYAVLLLILGTAAIHLVLEVAGRYHYPAISLFALLAGGGAVMVIESVSHSKINQ